MARRKSKRWTNLPSKVKKTAKKAPVITPERIHREGKQPWYWFDPEMITEKGNWRNVPPGVYFDRQSKILGV